MALFDRLFNKNPKQENGYDDLEQERRGEEPLAGTKGVAETNAPIGLSINGGPRTANTIIICNTTFAYTFTFPNSIHGREEVQRFYDMMHRYANSHDGRKRSSWGRKNKGEF